MRLRAVIGPLFGLVGSLTILGPGGAAPLPGPTSLPSAASVLAQDGAGWPTNWGVREGWVAPASYRLTFPPTNRPAAEAALDRAFAAVPHLFLTLAQSDLMGTAGGIYLHPLESGEAWERPVQVEYRSTADGTGFKIDAGLRIQGGWNRRPEESPKHSFRIAFRSRYGQSRLRFPLFPTGKNETDQLILRAGNNHSWLHWDGAERRRADYVRDPWMRATHAAMGHPAARSRPVHLHLNGLYWGVYDLCERPDAAFAARAWGGKASDYDARNADKILSGDSLAWDRLLQRINAGVTNAAGYEAVQAELDVPAFIDFTLLNLYGANADWDRSSNWYAARRRNPAGKWQFLVWDGERTLEAVNDNRLGDDDDLSPTRVFQKLRSWPGFRQEFARRAHRHLAPDGELGATRAAARYRQLTSPLGAALVAEAARWGDYRRSVHPYKQGPYETYTVENHWQPEVDRLLTQYFPARADAFIGQLKSADLWEER